MKVGLQFNFQPRCNACEISSNLWDEWGVHKGSRYALVHLQTYETPVPKVIVTECTLNDILPFDSIKLAGKLLDVNPLSPKVSSCRFEILEQRPPVLKSVTLLLRTSLYNKLMQLPNPCQRAEFLELKYGLRHLRTIVYDGYVVEPSLCRVSYCGPYSEGLVDFENTQIVFVSDDQDTTADDEIVDRFDEVLKETETGSISVKLSGLHHQVPPDLIYPTPAPNEDDSTFVFADFRTLLSLGVASGSYVKISDGKISRHLRIFILLAPLKARSFVVYASPRVIASFPEDMELSMSKLVIDVSQIPIASAVSVARVGGWNQVQKAYQGMILHNLRNFFISKRRVLHVGDMIPIPFDTNMASLYAEECSFEQLPDQPDALVWFFVESAKISDANEVGPGVEFYIDPDETKLLTANIVSKPPLKLSRCNYISYFNLEPVFPYNPRDFAYVSKLINVLTSSIECMSKGIALSTTILLYSTSPNTGKSSLVQYCALYLGYHLLHIDCMSLTVNVGSPDSTAKVVGYLRGKIESALSHASPAIVYLSHMDVLLVKADQSQDPDGSKGSKSMDLELAKLIKDLTHEYKSTVFVCSATDPESISTSVRNQIKFELAIQVPDERQRFAFFQWFLSTSTLNRGLTGSQRHYSTKSDVSFGKLSLQSAGLSPLDIQVIVNTAKYNCAKRVNELDKSTSWAASTYTITTTDLTSAISKAREDFSVSIGAPKIPNVTWADIGGMDQVKGEIMDTIEMPLKHPELFASGMKKRSGVLFYGPPGTGKTLMAKAIATNFSLNFFSVKGPELLNMYIGESEANVRRVFQKARDARPCVIFFDELDSVAPKRGNQGDSGGVMDRIVSQLLAELDGMGSGGEGVFVIGATNRPDLLDEALLRPGRFDKLLYLGISDTNEKQCNVISALTRKFKLDQDVNLMEVAEHCPFNYTGADFYALCSDAMLNAMTRTAGDVDKKVAEYNKLHKTDLSVRHWFDRVATAEDTEVTVRMVDFLKAQREMSASVSEEELKHYLRVKASFENAE